MNIHKKGMN